MIERLGKEGVILELKARKALRTPWSITILPLYASFNLKNVSLECVSYEDLKKQRRG